MIKKKNIENVLTNTRNKKRASPYAHLYTNKLDNLYETNKTLEKPNVLKLSQEKV